MAKTFRAVRGAGLLDPHRLNGPDGALRLRLRLSLAFSAPRNRLRRGMSATAEPALAHGERKVKGSNQSRTLCGVEYQVFNLTSLRLGEFKDRKSLSVLAHVTGKADEVAALVFHDRQAIDSCAVILDIRVCFDGARLRTRSNSDNKNRLI
jgi:hypothetical protein